MINLNYKSKVPRKEVFSIKEYDTTKLYKSAKDKYDIILDKRQDYDFFLNKDGEYQLNPRCEKCKKRQGCGQSWKSDLFKCDKFEKL